MSASAGAAADDATVGLSPGDRIALRALVDAYAVSVDRGDITGFLAVFTEDATLSTFEPDGSRRGAYHGHGELAAVPPALERYERTLHLVSTHLAEVAPGDDAGEVVGTTYCEAHHHRPADPPTGGRTDRVLHIRYDDRYARRGPGWRIRAREVHVLWQEDRPLP
ncbi:MAG TPA: nuclear transport factor 2 family protein [Acidimicrobiales bacterium]|nr:nuclear transport factor 2 family protein [Acidimicrobiales bacterium]